MDKKMSDTLNAMKTLIAEAAFDKADLEARIIAKIVARPEMEAFNAAVRESIKELAKELQAEGVPNERDDIHGVAVGVGRIFVSAYLSVASGLVKDSRTSGAQETLMEALYEAAGKCMAVMSMVGAAALKKDKRMGEVMSDITAAVMTERAGKMN